MQLWLGFWVVGDSRRALPSHAIAVWFGLGCAIIFNSDPELDFKSAPGGVLYIRRATCISDLRLGAGVAPWLGRTVKAPGLFFAAVLVVGCPDRRDNLPLVADFTAGFRSHPDPGEVTCQE